MAVNISAGLNVKEFDLTTIVPAVSTTAGALAAMFHWGPGNQATLVSSEVDLVARFGKPDDNNFESWFVASSFLAYGNTLWVSRAVSNVNYNAVANTGVGSTANVQVLNSDLFQTLSGASAAKAWFIAKYPGLLGNALRVSVCDSANAFYKVVANAAVTVAISANTGVNTGILTVTAAGANAAADTQAAAAVTAFIQSIPVNSFVTIGNQTIQFTGNTAGAVSGGANTGVSSIGLNFATNFNGAAVLTQVNLPVAWEFNSQVGSAPGTSPWVAARPNAGGTNIGDEMHIAVVDQTGVFSGVPGTLLEVFPNVSRATDALGQQGGSIYYKNVLNLSSKYVWATTDMTGLPSNTTATVVASSASSLFNVTMVGGGVSSGALTDTTIDISFLQNAYDVFKNSEQIDVSLVMAGKARGPGTVTQLGNYVIQNIGEFRKDCVVFVSPDINNVVNVPGNEVTNTVAFRNGMTDSSYAFLDSGYKYAYDRYNDKYRWVPLNGDTAGLACYTDDIRDPWWSPAGYNRGQLKNVIKLAFNPNKSDRDQLYKNNINPIVSFPGQGVVLFGDKTLQSKPSAFDRINVRRLFIVLEKAISTAAKYTLFEFNDDFTRAGFVNMVEPYLRTVQGRRGITAFKVVCDTTNNTPAVIDANQFVGTIFVKPNRSINFISLNFVATRTGVDFSSVVGGGF
jgi:hypothetical protein